MKLYRLPIQIEEPSEDSGGKYVAEVPILPGCRAWGDSAAEAVDHLQSVAAAFIESYREREMYCLRRCRSSLLNQERQPSAKSSSQCDLSRTDSQAAPAGLRIRPPGAW